MDAGLFRFGALALGIEELPHEPHRRGIERVGSRSGDAHEDSRSGDAAMASQAPNRVLTLAQAGMGTSVYGETVHQCLQRGVPQLLFLEKCRLILHRVPQHQVGSSGQDVVVKLGSRHKALPGIPRHIPRLLVQLQVGW